MNRERKDVIISFRIPEYLKSEMDKVKINWSEYLRKKIEEKLRLEEMRAILSEIEALKIRPGGKT